MFSDQELIKNIRAYANDSSRLAFHTPMHLGRTNYPEDLTELNGLDNLQYPNSTLKEAETSIAKVFATEKTFLLTNGASMGLAAAILAIRLFYESEAIPLKPVLVSRNAHKSVISGLILAKLDVEWLEVNYDKELDLYREIDSQNLSRYDFNKYSALLITNPTYDGFYTKLQDLKNLDIPIIVDEAHGAHFHFLAELPQPALKTKASIVIHSLHKTLGALTQSALAHINYGSKIPAEFYERALRLMQTTSPNYMILKSTVETVFDFHNKAKEYSSKIFELKALLKENESNYFTKNDDYMKLVIKSDQAELLESFLEKSNIFIEKKSKKCLTAFLSHLHQKDDIKRLINALEEFKNKYSTVRIESEANLNQAYLDFPEQLISPAEAYHGSSELIKFSEAEHRISSELFAPCPPGFPILVPGQKINQSVIHKLASCDDFLNYKCGIIRVVK